MPLDVELAHDLRMPLQLITASAQMLMLALKDPALDGQAYADILLASVRQAQRLLEAALNDRPGAVVPRLKNADIVAVVRGLCRSCRIPADEHGVALRYTGNVAALTMALDEDMLSRILLNLIANALRFTPPGGEIRVTLTARGDMVEIGVRDNGAGIPPERQPRVFLRGESDGGPGFGLPIALGLARALGGDLTLRSVPGKGSAFTLRLPVRAACAG